MTFYFLITALFSLNVHPACSCPPPGKIDSAQYNQYSLIVKGKVPSAKIKGDKLFGERIVRLKISKLYKGMLTKDTVSIFTPGNGETWLIYATANKEKFETDLCTRTKSMNPKAWNYNKAELGDDLKFLAALLKNN